MEFEFSFPMILLKFKKPAIWMQKFGKKHSRSIKLVGDIATVIGIFGMLLAFAFMVRGAVGVIKGGPAQVSIIIPGVHIPGSQVYIPLVQGLIVIFVMAVFHEGMHGIMAGAEGIRPKYAAFLLMLFIPAAGVELDEKEISKLSKLSRLRIFSSGSLGNFILALLCLGLMLPTANLASHIVKFDGLQVLNSSRIAFNENEIILAINGQDVRSLEGLMDNLKTLSPNEKIEIETNDRNFNATLNENGKLGVYLQPLFHYTSPMGGVLKFLLSILNLSFGINLGVGIINLLPLGILDGGRMMKDLHKKSAKVIGLVSFLLLLINIFGPMVF